MILVVRCQVSFSHFLWTLSIYLFNIFQWGSVLLQEEKCEDVTQGYTTEQKCTKWPKQVCSSQKKTVKKYTPETECKKVPRELCGPSGCVLTPGPEECFDKKETVVQEVI